MMAAAGTSERSEKFFLTTRRYNPEDSHLVTGPTQWSRALLKKLIVAQLVKKPLI
jgi:hypothetical protein